MKKTSVNKAGSKAAKAARKLKTGVAIASDVIVKSEIRQQKYGETARQNGVAASGGNGSES